MLKVNVRSVVAGSKLGCRSTSFLIWSSTCCTGTASCSARGVGETPREPRTNSGSPKAVRSLRKARLMAGWLIPRASAARLTLRSRSSRSKTTSRLRSTFLISIRVISTISTAASTDHSNVPRMPRRSSAGRRVATKGGSAMKRQMRCAGALVLAVVLQGYGAPGWAGDREEGAHHRPPVTGGPLRQPCETLAGSLSVPNTAFTASTSVAAGALSIAGKPIPAHCLLTGKMFERKSPVDGQTYAIGFEMRLPLDWNGRFFYQANGGIDGSVVTATGPTSGGGPLTSALLQGFAVISSDAGHNGAQNPTFGIDPQARLDYGYQAVGKLTPMAKRVIRVAYGKDPAFSYIGGCSNGGRHTMVAAARYADQYDGFLVGSPGFNLPKAAVASIYGAQQYAPIAVPGATIPAGPFAGLPDLSGAFTAAERQLVSDKVLERCDALDGLVDGLVQKVKACQREFNLQRDVTT